MEKGDPIPSGEVLYRRVYKADKRVIDRKIGRPTSRAFVPRPKDDGKLSCDLKRLTTFFLAIQDQSQFRLFMILSDTVYSCGLSCLYDPITENIAHTLITGFDPDDESVPGILARSSIEEFESR